MFVPRHPAPQTQIPTNPQAGVATLLFDLLTEHEASDRRNVFDIPLLASRLQGALEWLGAEGGLSENFPVGFFGASTGEWLGWVWGGDSLQWKGENDRGVCFCRLLLQMPGHTS